MNRIGKIIAVLMLIPVVFSCSYHEDADIFIMNCVPEVYAEDIADNYEYYSVDNLISRSEVSFIGLVLSTSVQSESRVDYYFEDRRFVTAHATVQVIELLHGDVQSVVTIAYNDALDYVEEDDPDIYEDIREGRIEDNIYNPLIGWRIVSGIYNNEPKDEFVSRCLYSYPIREDGVYLFSVGDSFFTSFVEPWIE